DPSQIRLRFDPVESIEVAENGDLRLSLGDRVLTMNTPYTYQVVDGVEVAVESQFILDNGDVAFAVGDYDRSRALIIDPVIAYAGYIGGSDRDSGLGIAVDGTGNAYVTGYTYSTQASFPVTGGPDLTHNGYWHDAFVAKVNPSGTALV